MRCAIQKVIKQDQHVSSRLVVTMLRWAVIAEVILIVAVAACFGGAALITRWLA